MCDCGRPERGIVTGEQGIMIGDSTLSHGKVRPNSLLAHMGSQEQSHDIRLTEQSVVTWDSISGAVVAWERRKSPSVSKCAGWFEGPVRFLTV